jgi:hypothetical protein
MREVASMGNEVEGKGLWAHSVRVDVVAPMLIVQTEECKNCRLLLEGTELKRKFADREINEYSQSIKEDILRPSKWILELAQRYSPPLL